MNADRKPIEERAARAYVKPATQKHQPVGIVRGTGGGYSLYYTSLYYSLYYTSLYYSLYYTSLYYCWVARAVYGASNPRWLAFRHWMLHRAPSWLRVLYGRYGERCAAFVSTRPRLTAALRGWMDARVEAALAAALRDRRVPATS